MKISQIIIKQNYFQFQDKLYIQEEGRTNFAYFLKYIHNTLKI